MPTARELLEQADALMRRNRERAAHAGIRQHAMGAPEVGAGIAEIAAAIPELTEVVTIGSPPTLPTTLDDVPELVDAVEEFEIEIEIASIADLSDEGNGSSAVPDLDRGGHGGDVAVFDSGASTPPVATESVPAPEPAPASSTAPAPQREPGRLWSLFSFGRKSNEPAAAIPAVRSVPPPREGSTVVAGSDGTTVVAAPAVEFAVHEAPATDVAGTISSLPIDGTVPASSRPVEAAGRTPTTPIATAASAPVASIESAVPVPAPSIDGTVPASMMPIDRAGSAQGPTDSPDSANPLTPVTPLQSEDAVVPPATAKPALADDWARWEALAEEIRMQVLQRIDIFTDTGLREQLTVQLQPIVDRASAELVTTINEHVGKLIRAYIAEAIEREIETWRKGNS